MGSQILCLGLKENVIIGKLIPAGTGYVSLPLYNKVHSKEEPAKAGGDRRW